MRKLNIGCGNRIAGGWVNIDFHSSNLNVKRVNLLNGFPYADNYFDAVYSSHLLEHFTNEQAIFLVNEAYRVLKPGGILRIVVPDLEGTCREYLNILALPDDHPDKSQKHRWIIIEMLDQLVRTFPGGEMGLYFNTLLNSDNQELINYVRSRTETILSTPIKSSFKDRLRRVSPQKIATKSIYLYLKAVSKLIPKRLRNMVFVETAIGERHRWMYDTYGLKLLLENSGFTECYDLSYNESGILGFQDDLLDCNADGSSYKNNSVYFEGKKKAK